MKLLILSFFLIASQTVFSQYCDKCKGYDTTLYREYIITEIKPSMKGGGRGYRFTLISDIDTIWVYRLRRESYKEKDHILIPKL